MTRGQERLPRQETINATVQFIFLLRKFIFNAIIRDRILMPLASVSIVEFTERSPVLRALGDRSHLRQSLQEREGT